MADKSNEKLDEQLVRCLLDDKIPTDIKLKKMDYIIRLGASVDTKHKTGYSLLSLAKIMGNEEIISFLEERGAKEFNPTSKKLRNFFRTANLQDINKFLNILPDGYVLECDINLCERQLEKLPDFSHVAIKGNFDCSFNGNKLVSLEGAPKEVSGNFDSSYNGLITLKGAPTKVGKSFNCGSNKLVTLDGVPKKIGKDFVCVSNELISLKGLQSKIYGDCNCSYNKITSLEGGPMEVDGNFTCSYNLFTTLDGAPKKVGKDFCCYSTYLVKLDGLSDNIGGEFYYFENNIKTNKIVNKISRWLEM